MNLLEFYNSFEREDVPNALIKLVGFENDISSYENFAEGFGIGTDYKSGLESWSENPEFIKKLYPFGQANGSGSFYCIWDYNDELNLDQMPIVVFGDEGGVHIIAENILQLLQLLTYDTEISVDFDEAYFYKDKDEYEASEDHKEFLKFVKTDFNIDLVSETESIIKNAQNKFKEKFDKWFGQYYDLE